MGVLAHSTGHSMALAPSKRGFLNSHQEEISFDDDLQNPPYSEKHPDGLVDISGSSNEGMRDYLEEYCAKYRENLPLSQVLEYGSVAGPEKLNVAMANFFNEWFNPCVPVEASNTMATNGVSSLLDMIAFNICDPGEGILMPVPTYFMFQRDLHDRSGVTVVPVRMSHPEDQFRAEFRFQVVKDLEKTYGDASRKGVKVKAVLLCNPSNPLGRYYSRETLIEIARFCGRHDLHLVADEIYALSGFPSMSNSLPTFTSVLSIPDDEKNRVVKENIHSLYGVSKDWAMGGLRLGFLVTRNVGLWNACRRVALFTWVTHFSTQMWTDFIQDNKNVQDYVRINRERLEKKYRAVTTLMGENGVPFLEANGALFIWIDLSRWLKYFPSDSSESETRETKLCRYFIQHGVFLSMGQLYMAPSPGHFRFVYTSPGNEADIAVRRIGAACRKLERQVGFGPETADDFSINSGDSELSGKKSRTEFKNNGTIGVSKLGLADRVVKFIACHTDSS
ncbi:pyridoxal phosphate-dependent transferase [Ilyonectria sp. MPI-CAGE-AT-0026]|nr:pyridoxal phosphate-dependent transferase [Ilyonectria sp. MPI-CAGE-AT-0026]